MAGLEYQSKEIRALKSIDSGRYPDTNKDFVKNMQRLNSNVDYISSYMITMQKGIDDANKTIIEQIQSFINDLIVLFAGGEPTGIELGDLKYIIQGLGALFGFNGPFPFSLLDAASHFFLGFVVPLPQFIDVIFDSIFAWAESLGLSPEFIDHLREFADAVSQLSVDIMDLITKIFGIFDIFGILGTGADMGPLAGFWNLLFDLFDGINATLFKPILDVLTGWSIPFIDVLTSIVELISSVIDGNGLTDPLNIISNLINAIINIPGMLINLILQPFNLPFLPLSHIGGPSVSPNLLVQPGFNDLDSLHPGTAWTRDATEGRTSPGSAKCSGSPGGFAKELLSVPIPVGPSESIDVSAWVKWSGLTYSGGSPVSIGIEKYLGTTPVGTMDVVATVASPSASQLTWLEFSGSYTTPSSGVDQIRLAFRVGSNVSGGQIYFDDASLKKVSSGFPQNWIFDLIPDLNDVRNFINDIIDTIITVVSGIPFVGGTLAQLLSWLTDWFDDTTYTAAQAGDAYVIATTIEPITYASQTVVNTIEPIVYDTVEVVDVVQAKAITQQNYSISTVTDSPRKASWESRYPIADVSFPEAWNSLIEVFGTTDGASAGTAHTHTLNQSGHVYSSPGGYTIANGNSRGVFLTITNTTVFDHMRLYAWCPSGTATDVTYGLHRIRPDGSSYEIVPAMQIAPQLTVSGSYIDVDLGGTLIVQAGEIYLLRVTNRSAAAVAVSAISQTAGANYNGFATTGSTLSNATSYTAAQITTGAGSTGLMNWGGLFRAASFYTPKTYVDDFNRPDFGALWIPGQIGMTIDFVNGEGRAAYGGSVNGDQSMIYMYPTGSDQTIVAADLWDLAGTARCGIIAHASREFNQMAYLGVGPTGANLYAGAWGSLGAAKASNSFTHVDGTNWGVYVDDVPAHDVFYIMRNNVDVASWTDSADLMKVGPDYRYGGKVISRASGVNAGKIDNWTMKDVA
jgi:hypothetical protein